LLEEEHLCAQHFEVDHTHRVEARHVSCAFARIQDQRAVLPLNPAPVGVAVQDEVVTVLMRVDLARITRSTRA
jgi:hypothetical protein